MAVNNNILAVTTTASFASQDEGHDLEASVQQKLPNPCTTMIITPVHDDRQRTIITGGRELSPLAASITQVSEMLSASKRREHELRQESLPVHTRLTTLETSVATLETRLASIEAIVYQHSRQIAHGEARISALEDRISSLGLDVNALKAREQAHAEILRPLLQYSLACHLVQVYNNAKGSTSVHLNFKHNVVVTAGYSDVQIIAALNLLLVDQKSKKLQTTRKTDPRVASVLSKRNVRALIKAIDSEGRNDAAHANRNPVKLLSDALHVQAFSQRAPGAVGMSDEMQYVIIMLLVSLGSEARATWAALEESDYIQPTQQQREYFAIYLDPPGDIDSE